MVDLRFLFNQVGIMLYAVMGLAFSSNTSPRSRAYHGTPISSFCVCVANYLVCSGVTEVRVARCGGPPPPCCLGSGSDIGMEDAAATAGCVEDEAVMLLLPCHNGCGVKDAAVAGGGAAPLWPQRRGGRGCCAIPPSLWRRRHGGGCG